MPQVCVPKEFFIKERKLYANFRFAFWRELFQNSVDAGSLHIKVNVVANGNDVNIDFDDDGHGMTRQVLDDVYFRLGASTKNDGGAVGGFGRARILTCFSMKNYTIHTLNNLVQGDGGSYDVAEVDSRKGCLLQVQMEDESLDSILDALKYYLSMSQLSCEVTLNGERWTSWCHKRQLTRTLDLDGVPFAYVYVNKSAGNRLLLMRVSGTVMYYQYIQAKAQVIVEIDPKMSREVLTANRDGMHTKYSSILNSFIDELAVNTMTALKPRFKRKNAKISGKGLFCSVSNNTIEKLKEIAPEENDFKEAALYYADGAAKRTISSGVGRASSGGTTNETGEMTKIAEVIGGSLPMSEAPKKWAPMIGAPFVRNMPDVFIIDETDNEHVRRVIDSYNPANWITCETQGKVYNKGGTLYKLLLMWKVACEAAIEALMKYDKNITNIIWGIGWLFDDSAQARCMSVPGGNIMLLNPVDDKGKMKYGLSSKEDQKALMAIAKHEVSHIVESMHNEEFALTLTMIDRFYNEKEVFRKMKETVAEI